MVKIKERMQTASKHWFETILDKSDIDRFDSDKDSRAERGIKHFRPSEAHNCPRALWYSRRGYVKSTPSISGLRRMSMGTLVHEFLDMRLKDHPQLHSTEELVGSDDMNPPILGSYDAIIINPEGEKELVEFKSYAEPSSKYKLYLPKADHVIQWNLYSYLTGVEKGFIFYLNKNSQQFKIYKQQRNLEVLNGVLNKFRDVEKYLEIDVIYPYQPDENHDWCDFKNQCQEDYFIKGE